MNDEGERDRNRDEHEGPWATELRGHGSRCREEHEDLEDTAPLGCPLLEVAEHDIADREDRCDQGDFKPGIHVRRRGECRSLTHEIELQDHTIRCRAAYRRRVRVTRANGLRTPELSLSMCHCQESFTRS